MPTIREVHLRHSRYYDNLLDELGKNYNLGGAYAVETLRELDLNWVNIRSAYSWAKENRRQIAEANHLCSKIPYSGRFILSLRLNAIELYEWLALGLDVAIEIDELIEKVHHLDNLAGLYRHLNMPNTAIALSESCISLIKEVGQTDSHEVIASFLNSLAMSYEAGGEIRKANDVLLEALGMARLHKNRIVEYKILADLGLTNYELADFQKATKYIENALAICRSFGDILGEMAALNNLGRMLGDMGKLEKAKKYHNDSIMLADKVGDTRMKALAIGNLGLSYMRKGKLKDAESCYSEARKILEESGFPMPVEMKSLENLLSVKSSFLVSMIYSLEVSSMHLNRWLGITSKKLMVKWGAPLQYAEDLFEASNWLYKLGYSEKAISTAKAAIKTLEDKNSPEDRSMKQKLEVWVSQIA